ncbi:MAG: response regulator [Myxococcota bacterium]
MRQGLAVLEGPVHCRVTPHEDKARLLDPGRGRRPLGSVLVVETDPMKGPSIRDALERAGCEVSLVRESTTGKGQLANGSFAAVVVDIAAPEGLELAHWMRDACVPTEVVVMTDCATAESAGEAIRLHACAHFVRPSMDLDALCECVERAVQSRASAMREHAGACGSMREQDHLSVRRCGLRGRAVLLLRCCWRR